MFVLAPSSSLCSNADSWESGRNPLMQNVSTRHQLGKKVCKIKCELWTHAPQQTATLFDHLVGAGREGHRHVEAQHLKSGQGPVPGDPFTHGNLLVTQGDYAAAGDGMLPFNRFNGSYKLLQVFR